KRGPAVDLPVVEPLGTAEVLQASRLPVDVAEEGDPLDELERESLAGLDVALERLGPATLDVHRRPAVDEPHDVEGPAQDRRVGASADRLRVWHVGAVERVDDAPLAQDAVVAALRRGGGRDAH